MKFIIRPKSDHWLPLSLTDSLTDCCLVDLINAILACEDAYSKVVIKLVGFCSDFSADADA